MINNEFDLNLFSINDVERIEICKGAQSTLYGSDAIAGVINIITVKKDVSKPFNVKATAAFGNKSTIRTNLQLYGKAGKLTYTARYAKLKTKGFSSAYDSAGTKDINKPIPWIIIIAIFSPIVIGLVIFGWYALKGEYDHLPEDSTEIE